MKSLANLLKSVLLNLGFLTTNNFNHLLSAAKRNICLRSIYNGESLSVCGLL